VWPTGGGLCDRVKVCVSKYEAALVTLAPNHEDRVGGPAITILDNYCSDIVKGTANVKSRNASKSAEAESALNISRNQGIMLREAAMKGEQQLGATPFQSISSSLGPRVREPDQERDVSPPLKQKKTTKKAQSSAISESLDDLKDMFVESQASMSQLPQIPIDHGLLAQQLYSDWLLKSNIVMVPDIIVQSTMLRNELMANKTLCQVLPNMPVEERDMFFKIKFDKAIAGA
jgi:hypothetical protein